jgi:hypothetical protein
MAAAAAPSLNPHDVARLRGPNLPGQAGLVVCRITPTVASRRAAITHPGHR